MRNFSTNAERGRMHGVRTVWKEYSRPEASVLEENERLQDENAKLRELCADMLLCISDGYDCYGCRYDDHEDCDHGYACVLQARARKLGIEVKDNE